MQPKSDAQLLREYAENGADAAFTELVQRHTNLVYSAALRQVESPAVAAEMAQNAFIGLAQGAKGLVPRLAAEAALGGWLCRSVRNLSLNHRRDEFRRQTRERQAMEALISIPEGEPDWDRLRRVLDDAMSELSEADYDALVMRFFQKQDFRAVGAAMGISDDTAQKRVSRALDKLRELLSQRGIRATTAALSIAISATISAAALTGTAVSSATVVATATKTLAMTTLQKTLVTVTVATLAGAGLYEARQAGQLRNQVRTLQQQQGPLAEQVQQLQRERARTAEQIAALKAQNEQLQSNQTTAELLKLRGEVGRLRAAQQQAAQNKAAGLDANDPALQNFLAIKAQAEQINRQFEKMPDKKIPEMKFLTDVDWLTATKEAKFDSEAGVRKTLSRIRDLAKNRMPIAQALSNFIQEHGGQLPSEMSQLKPYFKSALGTADDAVVEAILGRYKLLHSGKLSDLPQGAWVIAEKAPVDKDYDTRAKFGHGTSTIIATGIGEAGDPDDKTY
jgi:RNA polymerase sigma factor (sigma-70 family)